MDPRCKRSPCSKFYIVAIGPSNVTPIARWQTRVGGIKCNADACSRPDTNHCTECRTRKTKNALAAKAKYTKKPSRIEALLLSAVHRTNHNPKGDDSKKIERCQDELAYIGRTGVKRSYRALKSSRVRFSGQHPEPSIPLGNSSNRMNDVPKADLGKRPSAIEGCTSPAGARSATFPQAL